MMTNVLIRSHLTLALDGKNDGGICEVEKLFVMGFASFLMLVGVDSFYFKLREALGVSVS